eukprot:768657-Hanusia_phi.AAC.1
MIAENLSHDSYIIDEQKYIGPDETLISDNPNLSLNRIDLPDGSHHYFVKDSTTKYTIPQILQKLIKQRKLTRNKIEYKRVLLKDGTSHIGLLKQDAENITVSDLESEQVFQVNSMDVAEISDAYSDFEKAVFDSLQLAYKITANSLYGQTGAKTSQIYMKPIAQSTTSTGRNMILMAKKFVEEKYDADVIYGDSVMPYTPLMLKYNNKIHITTFENVEGVWFDYNVFKPYDNDRFFKEQLRVDAMVWTHVGWSKIVRIIRHKTVKKIFRITTNTGMIDVTEDHSLIDSKGNIIKPHDCTLGTKLLHSIPFIDTHTLHDGLSDQHLRQAYIDGVFMACGSLSSSDWQIIHHNMVFIEKCKEILENLVNIQLIIYPINNSNLCYRLTAVHQSDTCKLVDRYSHMFFQGSDKTVPNYILNGNSLCIQQFYKGTTQGFINQNRNLNISVDKQVTVQSLYILFQLIGYTVRIKYLYNVYILELCNKIYKKESIRSIRVLHERYYGYVYDVETEVGVFHAGIGNIIVKNTDSIFCKFNLTDDHENTIKGKDAIPYAIKLGQKIEKHIANELLYKYKPQALNYEKVLSPLILFSKKRYTGLLYETDPNKCYQKSMGIVLKRRDNAHIVKKVYGNIIDKILKDNDLTGSFQELNHILNKIVNGDVDLNDLIISKTLKSNYAAPDKIPHKALADKIALRDPGNTPAINDRIPFIYIENNDPYALQGERVEHPDYIREHPEIKPDYLFYITNQIMNPVIQLYTLCMESIPGYTYDAEYWRTKEIELKESRELYLDDVKRANRIQTLKEQTVMILLFSQYIDTLGGVIKRKTRKRDQEEVPTIIEEVTSDKHSEFSLKLKESKKDGTIALDITRNGEHVEKKIYKSDERSKETILIDEIAMIASSLPGEKITFKIDGFVRFLSKWNDLIASIHEKDEQVYMYDVISNAIAAIEYRNLSRYTKRISIQKLK